MTAGHVQKHNCQVVAYAVDTLYSAQHCIVYDMHIAFSYRGSHCCKRARTCRRGACLQQQCSSTSRDIATIHGTVQLACFSPKQLTSKLWDQVVLRRSPFFLYFVCWLLFDLNIACHTLFADEPASVHDTAQPLFFPIFLSSVYSLQQRWTSQA